MDPMNALKARLAKPRFPRSSQYDPHWIVENLMGPHVLWLAEYLSEALPLKPGMRILDLGCGKALSSIFFAKEFGVHVTAADLWIKAEDNARRIAAAGLADRVVPVHAEAHALPFEAESFDAIVSLDAYHYFGTGDLYLGAMAKLLKPGGRLGIVVPGVAHEIDSPPLHLKDWWEWEFCSFHAPAWWRRHWEKTGLLAVETADWMPEGKALWTEWNRLTAPLLGERGVYASREADMLDADSEGLLGFVRAVARKD
jgi:cyclopropane fatty-acyl-phospholipid synthase-like methyltransferase